MARSWWQLTPTCATTRIYRQSGPTALGWLRGSVASLGTIPFYRKSFPGARVDAILTLEGMFVGLDTGSSIELLDYGFVAGGTVVVDEPADSSDPRLIAFAEVPPVVFSETVGDLKKLAGAQEAAQSFPEE